MKVNCCEIRCTSCGNVWLSHEPNVRCSRCDCIDVNVYNGKAEPSLIIDDRASKRDWLKRCGIEVL